MASSFCRVVIALAVILSVTQVVISQGVKISTSLQAGAFELQLTSPIPAEVKNENVKEMLQGAAYRQEGCGNELVGRKAVRIGVAAGPQTTASSSLLTRQRPAHESRQLLSSGAEALRPSTLKKAIAAAAANDVIVVRASFNVSATIKIKKSLRFQASSAGVTIGFTGTSSLLTTYGVRVFGTSKLKVSFRGLTFDGFGIDPTLPGIYVVGKGKPKAGKGPQVLCTGVTMKRFRLIRRGTRVDIAARGAALSANVASRVSILASTIRDNFAIRRSEMYLCQVAFAGHGADPAASLAGVHASPAEDVWVGNLSRLVILSRSSPAAVNGNLTSSIVDDPTQLHAATPRACSPTSPGSHPPSDPPPRELAPPTSSSSLPSLGIATTNCSCESASFCDAAPGCPRESASFCSVTTGCPGDAATRFPWESACLCAAAACCPWSQPPSSPPPPAAKALPPPAASGASFCAAATVWPRESASFGIVAAGHPGVATARCQDLASFGVTAASHPGVAAAVCPWESASFGVTAVGCPWESASFGVTAAGCPRESASFGVTTASPPGVAPPATLGSQPPVASSPPATQVSPPPAAPGSQPPVASPPPATQVSPPPAAPGSQPPSGAPSPPPAAAPPLAGGIVSPPPPLPVPQLSEPSPPPTRTSPAVPPAVQSAPLAPPQAPAAISSFPPLSPLVHVRRQEAERDKVVRQALRVAVHVVHQLQGQQHHGCDPCHRATQMSTGANNSGVPLFRHPHPPSPPPRPRLALSLSFSLHPLLPRLLWMASCAGSQPTGRLASQPGSV
eukprot:jgi/Mesen1/10057/ME000730S09347